jgi:hypothetical protein
LDKPLLGPTCPPNQIEAEEAEEAPVQAADDEQQ